MKKNKIKSKCLLSGSLFVTAAKPKTPEITILTITDFVNSIKIPFDIKDKVLLSHPSNLKLSKDDCEKVCSWLTAP